MAGYSDSYRPPSSSYSASPNINTMVHPVSIHRTTMQEANPQTDAPRAPQTESMHAIHTPEPRSQRRPAPSKKTSSIWSPHLARDQRATRYSIWELPFISLLGEGGLLGRRNIQVLFFVVGFIFPFGEQDRSCPVFYFILLSAHLEIFFSSRAGHPDRIQC